MDPPPHPRPRRVTGEEINPNQITFPNGLGIERALDRQQRMEAQGQYRGGYSALGQYRHPSDPQFNLPGPYPSQNNPAYDYRTTTQYMPPPYAGTQYTGAQGGYNSDMTQYPRVSSSSSSQYPLRPSGMQERPYSASLSSSYPSLSNRFDNSDPDSGLGRDLDRQYGTNTSGGLYTMHSDRFEPTATRSNHDRSPSERTMLLSQPHSSSSNIPSWSQAPLQIPQRSTSNNIPSWASTVQLPPQRNNMLSMEQYP